MPLVFNTPARLFLTLAAFVLVAAVAAVSAIAVDRSLDDDDGRVCARQSGGSANVDEDALLEALQQSIDLPRMRAAVQALPPRQRDILEHLYWGGLDLPRAGAQMGLTKSGACRLHQRALSSLRRQLKSTRPHAAI